jgi:hypothetical protein
MTVSIIAVEPGYTYGDGYWMISDDQKNNNGYISSAKDGLMNIPETGWEYSVDDDDEWHQDDQLKFF